MSARPIRARLRAPNERKESPERPVFDQESGRTAVTSAGSMSEIWSKRMGRLVSDEDAKLFSARVLHLVEIFVRIEQRKT